MERIYVDGLVKYRAMLLQLIQDEEERRKFHKDLGGPIADELIASCDGYIGGYRRALDMLSFCFPEA